MVSSITNKTIGIILILLGIISFIFLFYPEKLILINYPFLLARYFNFIIFTYGGLVLVFYGISFFTGFLIPYYQANSHEKSKLNIYSSIIGFPFFLYLLILASVCLNDREIRTYKTIGIIFSFTMTLFCLWSFFSNLKNRSRIKH